VARCFHRYNNVTVCRSAGEFSVSSLSAATKPQLRFEVGDVTNRANEAPRIEILLTSSRDSVCCTYLL